MNLIDNFNKELNAAFTDAGVLGTDANKSRQQIQSKFDEFKESEEKEVRNSPEDYLTDSSDIKQIYLLVKNKKLSANKIKAKIKEFLKNPEELKDFLNSILKSKGKKNETKEATGTGGSSGSYETLFSGEEPTKKIETKEATDSGSSGSYVTPKAWAKSMSKKDWRGKSKTQIPGGKFVQVKKKCKRFPYCNQGDINALNITNESVFEKVINNISKKYGLTENEIKQIILKEIKSNPKH